MRRLRLDGDRPYCLKEFSRDERVTALKWRAEAESAENDTIIVTKQIYAVLLAQPRMKPQQT